MVLIFLEINLFHLIHAMKLYILMIIMLPLGLSIQYYIACHGITLKIFEKIFDILNKMLYYNYAIKQERMFGQALDLCKRYINMQT